jgi:hypothetical protein
MESSELMLLKSYPLSSSQYIEEKSITNEIFNQNSKMKTYLTTKEVHGLFIPEWLELVDKLAWLRHISLSCTMPSDVLPPHRHDDTAFHVVLEPENIPYIVPLLMVKNVIHYDPECLYHRCNSTLDLVLQDAELLPQPPPEQSRVVERMRHGDPRANVELVEEHRVVVHLVRTISQATHPPQRHYVAWEGGGGVRWEGPGHPYS